MELSKTLINTPQTERGGEIAQRGFDFQSCWALSHMLEYELEGKEYVFVFEFHDDVLILDSESDPKRVTFAQVKTNEGSWTLPKLINSTKKKPISFIGKLFEHKKRFGDKGVELMFVTNAYFSFESRNIFGAHEIDNKLQTNIKSKVSDQIGKGSSVELKSLTFLTSDLSLEGHSSHLKGKICDFFDKYFENDIDVNPSSFAKTLESACRDRSKVRSSDIKDFDELVKKKGLSSSFIRDSLQSICESKRLEPNWESARAIFSDLGKSSIELISLQATFSRVSISIKRDNSVEKSYLENAESIYDKNKLHRSLILYVEELKSNLEVSVPDYSLALTSSQKESIIVYSIIKNLIGGEEL